MHKIFLNKSLEIFCYNLNSVTFHNIQPNLFKYLEKDKFYYINDVFYDKMERFISKHYNSNKILLNDISFILEITNILWQREESKELFRNKKQSIKLIFQKLSTLFPLYSLKTKNSQYLLTGFISSYTGIIENEKAFNENRQAFSGYGKLRKTDKKFIKDKKYSPWEEFLIADIKSLVKDLSHFKADTGFIPYTAINHSIITTKPFTNKNKTFKPEITDKFHQEWETLVLYKNDIINEQYLLKKIILIEDGLFEVVNQNGIVYYLEPNNYFFLPTDLGYKLRSTCTAIIKTYNYSRIAENDTFKEWNKKFIAKINNLLTHINDADKLVGRDKLIKLLENKDYLILLIHIKQLASFCQLTMDETAQILYELYPERDFDYIKKHIWI